MSRFWSPVVQTLTPYVPGEQPQMQRLVKLNTNESPYGPSPKAITAIDDQNNEDLRLYPDPEGAALKKAIELTADNIQNIPPRNFIDSQALAPEAIQELKSYFPDISNYKAIHYLINHEHFLLTEQEQLMVEEIEQKNKFR